MRTRGVCVIFMMLQWKVKSEQSGTGRRQNIQPQSRKYRISIVRVLKSSFSPHPYIFFLPCCLVYLALVASQSPSLPALLSPAVVVVVALFLAHSSVRFALVCVDNFTCACRARFAAFLTAGVDSAAMITHQHTPAGIHSAHQHTRTSVCEPNLL